MASKKVKVVISRNGEIAWDWSGFKGKDCLKEMNEVLEAMRERGVESDVKETVLKDPEQPDKESGKRRQKTGE